MSDWAIRIPDTRNTFSDCDPGELPRADIVEVALALWAIAERLGAIYQRLEGSEL